MSAQRGAQLTGRHVLWLLLGFFAVVTAVNGVFVALALVTWSGLETDNAYGKGLRYNERLEAAAAQAALGWSVAHAVQREDGGAVLEVRASDRDGRPLSGLRVRASLLHPADSRRDRALLLTEAGAGRYRATLSPRPSGQWRLQLLAEHADGTRFVREDRLWLN